MPQAVRGDAKVALGDAVAFEAVVDPPDGLLERVVGIAEVLIDGADLALG